MRFSISDIIYLTAYVGLLLANNDRLTAGLLIASACAGLLLVCVLLGSTFQRLSAHGRTAGEEMPKFAFAIFAAGMLSLAGAFAVRIGWVEYYVHGGLWYAGVGAPRAITVVEQLKVVSAAGVIGMVAASLPVVFALDSRYRIVSGRLLTVGYWALTAGIIGGVAAGMGAFALQTPLSSMLSMTYLRLYAFGGLLPGITTCLAMSYANAHHVTTACDPDGQQAISTLDHQ